MNVKYVIVAKFYVVNMSFNDIREKNSRENFLIYGYIAIITLRKRYLVVVLSRGC